MWKSHLIRKEYMILFGIYRQMNKGLPNLPKTSYKWKMITLFNLLMSSGPIEKSNICNKSTINFSTNKDHIFQQDLNSLMNIMLIQFPNKLSMLTKRRIINYCIRVVRIFNIQFTTDQFLWNTK